MSRTNTCLIAIILVVLFLPTLAYAQKEQEFSFDFNREIDPAVCAFPGLNLSLNTKIYATAAYKGGEKLDWQIGDSGHKVTLFKIVVNSPQEPVVLNLSAYDPSVWHISWTKGTQIIAVVLSGYHTQRIAGLPKAVPVLNSTYEEKGPCGYTSYSSGDSKIVNKLFGRNVDEFFAAKGGRAIIGEALPPDAELITNEESRIKDSYDPHKPLVGQAGLDEAVSKGLIRKATKEDILKYSNTVIKASGLPDHYVNAGNVFLLTPYVVLSPDFIIPPSIGGGVTFFLPDGMPQPKGPTDHCVFKNLTDGESYLEDYKRLVTAYNYPDFKLPSNTKIYAAGAYSGSKLGIQIDDTGHEATLMQVIVNSPEEPVALLLGAYEPTIWHLSWTRGTKILAVIVSDCHKQLLVGAPEDIPIIIGSRSQPKTYCFDVRPDIGSTLLINELSKHAFKKNLDHAYHAHNGKVLVGKPLPNDAEVETTEEFKIEKFTDPQKPLAGKAGLDEAEGKGLIRKANREDYIKWLAQYARRQNVPEDQIEEGINSGRVRFEYPARNAYIVLSPDFVIPSGLSGRDYADFIIPENVPLPQGPKWKPVLYLLKDGTCVGPHPGCIHSR